MKRRDGVTSVLAVGLAAPVVGAQSLKAKHDEEHEGHGHGHGDDDERLRNHTVSLGHWNPTPRTTPIDRFGANPNPRTLNGHHLIPSPVRVRVGDTVSFIISGFHNVVVYGPGTRPADLDRTNLLTSPPQTFPPLINDPNDRLYRGLDPRTQTTQDRVEVVGFNTAGKYLVICGVLPHFFDAASGAERRTGRSTVCPWAQTRICCSQSASCSARPVTPDTAKVVIADASLRSVGERSRACWICARPSRRRLASMRSQRSRRPLASVTQRRGCTSRRMSSTPVPFGAGSQVHAVRDEARAHRRIQRDGYFFRRRVDERAELRAGVRERLVAGERFAVSLEVGPVGEIGVQAFDALVHDHDHVPRRCAQRARVAGGDRLGKQEPLARGRKKRTRRDDPGRYGPGDGGVAEAEARTIGGCGLSKVLPRVRMVGTTSTSISNKTWKLGGWAAPSVIPVRLPVRLVLWLRRLPSPVPRAPQRQVRESGS